MRLYILHVTYLMDNYRYGCNHRNCPGLWEINESHGEQSINIYRDHTCKKSDHRKSEQRIFQKIIKVNADKAVQGDPEELFKHLSRKYVIWPYFIVENILIYCENKITFNWN